jgi:hypothetical protein
MSQLCLGTLKNQNPSPSSGWKMANQALSRKGLSKLAEADGPPLLRHLEDGIH